MKLGVIYKNKKTGKKRVLTFKHKMCELYYLGRLDDPHTISIVSRMELLTLWEKTDESMNIPGLTD